MKIIVPIKQVPETSEVKMDQKTGTMIREGVETIINPLDLYAIESALRLREQYGGEVIVISMGPPKALEAVKEAISMGCDRGCLLSDKSFGGADTWATAYVLSQGIQKEGPFDLIICGERATDGETGQVGPGIAAFLELSLATFVKKIIDLDRRKLRVERLVEGGCERLEIDCPALLTVVKEVGEPRLPTLDGKQRARKEVIPVFGRAEIDAAPDKVGLKGSPTRVIKISQPVISRNCRKLFAKDDEAVEETVHQLLRFLEERYLI